jgi:hypothetical protein
MFGRMRLPAIDVRLRVIRWRSLLLALRIMFWPGLRRGLRIDLWTTLCSLLRFALLRRLRSLRAALRKLLRACLRVGVCAPLSRTVWGWMLWKRFSELRGWSLRGGLLSHV